MQRLEDKDGSINWVESADIGKQETRLVYREDKTIVYLSAQTGCDHACRMCHLTQTGQIEYRNVTIKELIDNCTKALTADLHSGNNKLHINFMARGEPLVNEELVNNWKIFSEYVESLKKWEHPCGSRFGNHHDVSVLISTILPQTFYFEDLQKLATGPIWPKLYYSGYSANPDFRKRWLPKAHSFATGLKYLKEWKFMGGECRIHFPFIAGENDKSWEVEQMCELIAAEKMHVNFNIVRYNPPNDKSVESSEEVIQRNIEIINKMLPYSKVKIIPRVGYEVKASCGMFAS